MWVIHVHLFIWACRGIYTCIQMCGGILLNHFLVYYFERRYLPEPGAHPLARLSVLWVPGVQLFPHTVACFTWALRNWTHAFTAIILLMSQLPRTKTSLRPWMSVELRPLHFLSMIWADLKNFYILILVKICETQDINLLSAHIQDHQCHHLFPLHLVPLKGL